MDVTVNDKWFAEQNHKDFDFVVSIFDPHFKAPFSHGDRDVHFVAHFEDTEHPREKDFMQMDREVRTILAWTSKLPDDAKLLVHCHAGVSRSSAIAWLILIQHGSDPVEAFQSIFKKRSVIWPNTVVMSIGAKFLKLDPDFMITVARINGEIASRRSDTGYF